MSSQLRALERRVDALIARANKFERSEQPASAREVARRELQRTRDPQYVRRLENIARHGVDPSALRPGELREVVSTDRTGRRITEFVGDPECVWARFKLPTRRARFASQIIDGINRQRGLA